jgi:hypothetical protein
MRPVPLLPELIFAVSLIVIAGGCSTFSGEALPPAVQVVPAEVYVRPLVEADPRSRLAVFLFRSPHYAPGAELPVTEAYFRELLRQGFFSQVTLIPDHAPDWKGRALPASLNGFDLLLTGEIAYLLAGSGGAPSHLMIEVQMIDLSRRALIWYSRQQAYSSSTPEVDLIWHTLPGEPAQPYQTLAAVLAQQLVDAMKPSGMDRHSQDAQGPATPVPAGAAEHAPSDSAGSARDF